MSTCRHVAAAAAEARRPSGHEQAGSAGASMLGGEGEGASRCSLKGERAPSLSAAGKNVKHQCGPAQGNGPIAQAPSGRARRGCRTADELDVIGQPEVRHRHPGFAVCQDVRDAGLTGAPALRKSQAVIASSCRHRHAVHVSGSRAGPRTLCQENWEDAATRDQGEGSTGEAAHYLRGGGDVPGEDAEVRTELLRDLAARWFTIKAYLALSTLSPTPFGAPLTAPKGDLPTPKLSRACWN